MGGPGPIAPLGRVGAEEAFKSPVQFGRGASGQSEGALWAFRDRRCDEEASVAPSDEPDT